MNFALNAVSRALRAWTTPQPKVTSRFVPRVEAELELMEELGSGRYGIVRVGRRKLGPPDERIAVKIVPKARGSMRELENEIKCLSKVAGHKNVMQLLDAFEDKTHAYLLTPMYSGGELFDRIVSQRIFTEADASRNMSHLLSAIAHCHARSVVHRDVKPENLLYSNPNPNAELVLVDFGMAREFSHSEDKCMSLQCGSPSYVAPEVLARSYDEKCDVWSCGIIMHILLVGRTPFGNGADDEILSRVEQFDPSLDLALEEEDWQDVSKEAKDLLSALLERDPEKRLSPLQALNHPWIVNNIKTEDEVSSVSPASRQLVLRNALENMREFNKHRRLKRAAIRVIAALARDEDSAKRFTSLLSTLERDAKGRIKLSDLAEIVPSQATEGLRVSSGGMVDPNEVLAAALAQSIYLDEHYLLAAFKKFDVSGDGRIDKQELAQALGKDPNVDQELVMEAMRHADKDGNGYITFEEFVSVVRERAGPEMIKKRETTMGFGRTR